MNNFVGSGQTGALRSCAVVCGDAKFCVSIGTRFSACKYTTREHGLSRVLENFYFAGCLADTKNVLTNRGRIVNFWGGVSQEIGGSAVIACPGGFEIAAQGRDEEERFR